MRTDDVALARDYARLKTELAAAHPNDRNAYTAGKSEFISGVMQRASPNEPWA